MSKHDEEFINPDDDDYYKRRSDYEVEADKILGNYDINDPSSFEITPEQKNQLNELKVKYNLLERDSSTLEDPSSISTSSNFQKYSAFDDNISLVKELMLTSDQKWRKQWDDKDFNQKNYLTNIDYRNTNQLTLFKASIDNKYTDPRWMTFKQMKSEKSITLNKGSHGTPIYFFNGNYQKLIRDKNNNPILDSDGNKQYQQELGKIVLKKYFLFNASDMQGIKPLEKPEPIPQDQLKQNIEHVINNYFDKYKIEFQQKPSSIACSKNIGERNIIVMPLKEQFNNIDSYYMTLFHEMTHSTQYIGIRKPSNDFTFGSASYAKEELTAELGSLFIAKELGIKSEYHKDNSIAYLKSWYNSGNLSDNDIATALKDAQKASNIITGFTEKIEQSLKIEQDSNKLQNTFNNEKKVIKL